MTRGLNKSFSGKGVGISGEIGRATVHGHANMAVGAAFGQDPSLAAYASGVLGSLGGSGLHKAGPLGQI